MISAVLVSAFLQANLLNSPPSQLEEPVICRAAVRDLQAALSPAEATGPRSDIQEKLRAQLEEELHIPVFIVRAEQYSFVARGSYNSFNRLHISPWRSQEELIHIGFRYPLVTIQQRMASSVEVTTAFREDSGELILDEIYRRQLLQSLQNYKRMFPYNGPRIFGAALDFYMNRMGLLVEIKNGETIHSAISFGRFTVRHLLAYDNLLNRMWEEGKLLGADSHFDNAIILPNDGQAEGASSGLPAIVPVDFEMYYPHEDFHPHYLFNALNDEIGRKRMVREAKENAQRHGTKLTEKEGQALESEPNFVKEFTRILKGGT